MSDQRRRLEGTVLDAAAEWHLRVTQAAGDAPPAEGAAAARKAADDLYEAIDRWLKPEPTQEETP